MIDFLLPLNGVRAMSSSVNKGLWLASIRWPDIAAGVQWIINGCRDEPVMAMEPVFGERIKAVKQACELLERQYSMQPAWLSCDFCVRVFVPPYNNWYVVRLRMEAQRLKRNNSTSRPAGGRAVGRVDKLVEAGVKKRKQKDFA